MGKKITALLLFAVIGSLSLTGLLCPDRMFSVREKRKLQQRPGFTLASFLDHSWQNQQERYLLDQFPGRDSWVQGKKVWDLAMGRRETGNVYVGSDGYLMDTGRRISQEQFEKNVKILAEFTDKVTGNYQIPIHVILVPTAVQILNDKLPLFAPVPDQNAMTEFARNEGIPVVDVLKKLENHRDQELYYRTDHHYTSLGAWYCYEAWREARGLEPDSQQNWTRQVLCNNFYGTTYFKASLPWIRPDRITAWYQHSDHSVLYNGTEQEKSIYHRKSLEGQDQYAVFLNSNQPLSVIEGSGKEGKLLLLKDSFGNTFSQFPAEEFQQVHAIDLRFFWEDLGQYIEKNGITQVLVLYGMENFAGDQNLYFPAE